MVDELVVAGRYRLLVPLGSGATAEVHSALDLRTDRQVAVKLFSGDTEVSDPRRFATEVEALTSVSHPNLVAVHDAGVDDGTAYVVLRLVQGRTLTDRLHDGPLLPGEVRRLGAVLADVLAHVHSRGIVHRDVKPSNILLDESGEPHLVDFGLALLAEATRLTRSDRMVGTAAYLSPEQVRGAEVGPAADVYALGLVLLECLTGQREYRGAEVEAAVARLHRAPLIPADLPADLVRLLSLMTSLTPRRRPSAATCAQTLAPASTAIAPLIAHRRFAKPALAAGVAVLAAAGAVFALTAPSAPGPTTPPVATPTSTPGQLVPAIPPQRSAVAEIVRTQEPEQAPAPVADAATVPTAQQGPGEAGNSGRVPPGQAKKTEKKNPKEDG
ncbi:serine/threonine-protein kinase [Actinokineospora pegani]|uniref:serine/threonine-protein kinase n=1 Tax=Actinokineospora pegani TaxID=2654637 RepID=UPI0012EAFCD4|nr:serine/threonine-protein kinase [Actinokineospora pegani]